MSGINRLIRGILIELLDNFTGVLVSTPLGYSALREPRRGGHTAKDVKRPRRRTVRLGFHELRVEAEAYRRMEADPVGGVDHHLAFDALQFFVNIIF